MTLSAPDLEYHWDGHRLMPSRKLGDNGKVDKLTQEFLAESFEGLDRMERCLTDLEAHPEDATPVREIFRAVHTIKGTTGFLGYRRLERLAHAGENVLGALRSGTLRPTSDVVSGLLRLLDEMRSAVRVIAETGREDERAAECDAGLIGLLDGFDQTGATAKLRTDTTPIPAEPAPAAERSGESVSERTLRVDAEVLNRMMNLVGELVLTRNEILQSGGRRSLRDGDGQGLNEEVARRLDSVTGDLRMTVMQARMQPVGQVFGRFPRMMRDLAIRCGKQVRLEISGHDTGLDRALLEAIKDPLAHALRNAVDHGIEAPAERAAAAKPEQGTIRVTATQRSGWVVIEIEDDGAGVALDRVRAKAVERGFISKEHAARLSEHEVLQLLFLPGFSTAGGVTRVSGRGVGMDVVKSNVERIGGRVEMESREGQGTRLRLRLPMTIAIMPALLVSTCGVSFCIPQSALAEMVYVRRADVGRLIETIGELQLYRLGEALLPIVSLDRLLHIEKSRRRRAEHGFYLVVLEADGRRFGLAVDELMTPEEIVVKPLSCGLRQIPLFSGATVLGNGAIAMILNVPAMATLAGAHAVAEPQLSSSPGAATAPSPSQFVLYEGEIHGRLPEKVAVPLEEVERICTVRLSEIEYAGSQAVLRADGELVELEDVSGLLRELESHGALADGNTELTVLLSPAGGRRPRRGLIVRQVLDVVTIDALPDLVCYRPTQRVDPEPLATVPAGFASALRPEVSRPGVRQLLEASR